jgi:hypothetical protein
MKSTRTGTVKPQAEEPLEEQRLTEDTAIETLFALAARLNRRRKEEYDLTFSSMLAAFMIANDQVSSWFKAYVRDSDAPISFFLDRLGWNRDELSSIGSETITDEEIQKQKRRTLTAKQLLEAAAKFARPTGPKLDPVSLMGAYIYKPIRHENMLNEAKWDRPYWSNAFLGHIAEQFGIELDFWLNMHAQTFGADKDRDYSGAAKTSEQTAGTSGHTTEEIGQSAEDTGPRQPDYNADACDYESLLEIDSPTNDWLDIRSDVNALASLIVSGRFKTSQSGSNQNQPLFSFKPVRVILARGDLSSWQIQR